MILSAPRDGARGEQQQQQYSHWVVLVATRPLWTDDAGPARAACIWAGV